MAELTLGTLYDFNKQAMAQEKVLDPIQFNKKTAELAAWMEEHSQYWMLLCHERRDYTIFIPLTFNGILSELRECLSNRGQILSIDKQENGSYEIWIRDLATNENFAYYLFDYRDGIIKA